MSENDLTFSMLERDLTFSVLERDLTFSQSVLERDLTFSKSVLEKDLTFSVLEKIIYDPHHKKSCLRGFRPCLTQTRLITGF